MQTTYDISTVHDYTTLRDATTLHPLISIVDFAKTKPRKKLEATALRFGVYAIFLKEGEYCKLHYGRKNYDYQDGTLVFVGPNQTVKIHSYSPDYRPSGYALLFHPDLLLRTGLRKKMDKYSFFSYEVREALHISIKERQTVLDCFAKITDELEQGIDKHSKSLIISNLELLLNYCVRFYDRQFITRENTHQGIVTRFDHLLADYFQSDQPQVNGLPSVKYCAKELHLSANYFGDLIKNETGKTAQEYIQAKVILAAKEKIFDATKTISQVAFELGFKYPQHFSRFFKQQVGYTPNEYKKLN